MVYTITPILSFLTLILDIIIILYLILLLYEKFILKAKSNLGRKINYFLSDNYLLFGLIFTLIGTLGSLYYSEVLGYEPCRLCWYQRILLYPQVIIFSIALFKKDNSIAKYILTLSAIGILISGFHYYLQITKTHSFACSIVGYSVSCLQTFFLNYGYITIPIMSFTVFLTLFILSLTELKE